jgi:hypothetical protein
MKIACAGGVAIFNTGIDAWGSRLILNLKVEIKASGLIWCQELQSNYLI